MVLEPRLVQVGGKDHRLQGEQIGGGQNGLLLLVTGVAPGGLAVVEPVPQALKDLGGVEVLLVPLAGLGVLLDAALHHFQVRHHQFQVDDVDVPGRVAAALYVDDIGVVKAAHHVDDGVGLPDVGQELVAQALPLGGPLHQARDVHKLNDCRGGLLGLIDLSQLVQPLIGDGDHAHVGVDGAEGVVGRFRPGVGDGVKQGALAHVGQAHDSQFHGVVQSFLCGGSAGLPARPVCRLYYRGNQEKTQGEAPPRLGRQKAPSFSPKRRISCISGKLFFCTTS